MKLLASLTILGLVMAQSVTAQTISYNQSYMRQLVPNLGKHGSGRKL